MSRRFSCLVAPVLILLLSTTAGARSWVVHPDGGGDAPTIDAAIDSVSGTDIIELIDGTYTGDGNRDLHNNEKAIVIRSISGDPTACIIDCQGSENDQHRFIAFYGGG